MKQLFSITVPGQTAALASPENLQKCRFSGPTSDLLHQKFWRGPRNLFYQIFQMTWLTHFESPCSTVPCQGRPAAAPVSLGAWENAESQAQPRHTESDSAFCQDPQGTHVCVWEALSRALAQCCAMEIELNHTYKNF